MTDAPRVCVVTGASSGIGLETARQLASGGHRVFLVGRHPERTHAARDAIRREVGHDAVEAFLADFSSLAEVRALAEAITARTDTLHVLVNNAGLWHPRRQLSRDGFEDTLAVNYFAPFLLTRLLVPLLSRSAPARIVHVSSRLHERERAFHHEDPQSERHYRGIRAYAQSKLANVMFSNELAHRLQPRGVTSNAVHPGDVATDIVRDNRLLSWGIRLFALVATTPEEAARNSVHVALDPTLEGVTGRYFKKCKEARPSPVVLDREACALLWRWTCEQLALPDAL